MAVDVSQGATKIPNRLFRVPVVKEEMAGPAAFHWDVNTGGKKFLIDTIAEGAAEPVIVVLNWMAGFSRN